jgi:hypothetical protein
MRALVPIVLAVSLAGAVHAQELDLRRAGLPREVAQHLQLVVEDPATTKLTGNASIDATQVIEGHVVITSGTLVVAGTIRGELVALRSDVTLEPEARVEGDITVVGGSLRGEDQALLRGTVTVYGEGFALWERARRFHDAPAWWEDVQWPDHSGGAELRIRVAENYNRVEGLPVQFGPDIRTGGMNRTRIEALAVWRTDVGPLTETNHMGYVARVEQFIGEGTAFRLGASVRSTVQPIESWSVTNLEASLAAALFHEDQRDYFEREGWSGYFRVVPRGAPVDVTVEYRDERHRSVAARDPWTLFNGDDLWRAQPLVGEGDIRMLRALAELDARRGEDFAKRGWYLKAELTRGVDGELVVPGADALPGSAAPALSPIRYPGRFTSGLVDLRRYQQAGFGGILGMRVIAGGSLDGSAVAPQFQNALGGAGSLPGYPLFSADCGARRALVMRADAVLASGGAVFPAFGCDRFALAQIEYRGGFDFHLSPWGDERADERWHFDTDVDWTIFFDAGRGWALDSDRVAGRANTRTLLDVGAGVILGGLGVYGAVPLDDEAERGIRLFVRLGPRF